MNLAKASFADHIVYDDFFEISTDWLKNIISCGNLDLDYLQFFINPV